MGLSSLTTLLSRVMGTPVPITLTSSLDLVSVLFTASKIDQATLPGHHVAPSAWLPL